MSGYYSTIPLIACFQLSKLSSIYSLHSEQITNIICEDNGRFMGHPHLIRPPVCPSPLPTRKGSAPNPWCHPTLTLNHSVTLLHTSRLACFLHILHYPHLLLLPLIFLHKPPLLAPVICLLKICKHTMPLFRKYRIRRDPTWHKAVPAPHKIGILFLSVASTTLSQSFIVYDSLTLFHYNYFNSPIYLYY